MAVDTLSTNSIDGLDPIYGIFRAVVENVSDPEKRGRVQVRVPQLHGIGTDSSGSVKGLPTGSLPWAIQLSLFGAGYDHGSMYIPDVGDIVFLMFENGDRTSPVYIGGSFGKDSKRIKTYGKIGDTSTEGLYNNGGWSSPSHDNEIPQGIYNQAGSPTGKVIFKTPKGATLYVQEEDGNEYVELLDRMGQCIRLSAPIDSSNNAQNMSKRNNANAYNMDALDPVLVGSSGGEILIRDAANQTIRTYAMGEDSYMEIYSNNKTTKVTIDFESLTVETKSVIVKLGGDENIEITNKHTQIVTDEETFLTSGSVRIDSPTITINGDVQVNGNIHATGSIIADGSNSNHHSH